MLEPRPFEMIEFHQESVSCTIKSGTAFGRVLLLGRSEGRERMEREDVVEQELCEKKNPLLLL